MKKHLFVALMCLCIGASASAGVTKPAVSKNKATKVLAAKKTAVVKPAPKVEFECFSFSWTPFCETSPMTTTVCGPGVVSDLQLHIDSAEAAIADVLCILCGVEPFMP